MIDKFQYKIQVIETVFNLKKPLSDSVRLIAFAKIFVKKEAELKYI